jgi:ubiquinone/menaquinone biosynthesis C-methylase UbiE
LDNNESITNNVNDVIVWPIPAEILESPSVTNRNLFAQKLKDENPNKILQTYAYFDCLEIDSFYSSVFDLIPDIKLAGAGVELGAGTCGFTSAVCKNFSDIKTIHAVELVPDVVRLLQPKTILSICGEKAGKIERVIGSFDNLQLADKSTDFAIEVESLHHSDNIEKTLREVHRVLKIGGLLIILDRVHNNSLSEEQIEFMLNVEYSDEWKIKNGYDMSTLTRRDNGEHEIRLSEWMTALEKTGFSIEKRLELREVSLKKIIKSLILTLPFKVRKFLNILPSRVMPQEGELLWMLRHLLKYKKKSNNFLFKSSIRDYTIFVARKSASNR